MRLSYLGGTTGAAPLGEEAGISLKATEMVSNERNGR